MFDKEHYDSPPMYSPPYSPTNGYGPPASFHASRTELDAYPPPPGSYYIEEKPQLFYKLFSPPGIVKAMEGLIVVLCLGIFACVASTLVWDMGQYGMGMGGYGGGCCTAWGEECPCKANESSGVLFLSRGHSFLKTIVLEKTVLSVRFDVERCLV